MKSKFFSALAVLIGTTVGAGFLGIPYVISKAGFFPGVIYLLLIAIFMLFVKLYLGEVILRTNGNHQLTGYAGRYLGKTGKYLMFFAMIFGIYSALIAYLIGEGKSLSYVLFGNEGYSFMISIFFWAIMAGFTYIGLKALKKYEKIVVFGVLVFVVFIFFYFLSGIRAENLTYVDNESLFLPFGVILFSFLAFSAMPEVERVLSGQEKLMKKVIFYGATIPLIVYFLFALVIVGNFGVGTPEIATLALGRFFCILGVLTMFTAFFVLTIALRDMFRFDFKLGRFKGWLLAILVPLVFFLLLSFFKIAGFIQLLSVSGVVSGGLTGILILLMNVNAKKKGNRTPEYEIGINSIIIFILSLIFILGVALEIFL